MGGLLTFFIILYGIVCVLLVLLVIIQGGKAEGLFASAQANVLGSRGTDVLTKMTRILSAIFIVGALLISIFISSQRTVFDTVDTTQPNTSLVAPLDTTNMASTNDIKVLPLEPFINQDATENTTAAGTETE